RLQKLLARRLQRLLGFPPLGDVAGDLGEADQLAVLANGVQHAVRPEAAAVLAEPPALLLVDAFARRGLERLLWHLPLPVLGGVEAGEVPADDLLGAVALDALRARIPVGDAPGRIEHEDRIVGDALDQQAEVALAGPQGLLGLLALGHVAADLDVADEGAVVVADRVERGQHPEAAAVLAHAPALVLEAPGFRRRPQGTAR